MDVKHSMRLLSISPDMFFAKMSLLTRKERIEYAKNMLVEAKKQAKLLMAKYHPDRGGDAEKFKEINSALQNIEKETEAFIEKMNKIIIDAESRDAQKTKIIIGP